MRPGDMALMQGCLVTERGLASVRALPIFGNQAFQSGNVPCPSPSSYPFRTNSADRRRRAESSLGLATVRTHYSPFFTIYEETWTGDRLALNIRAMGQGATGSIDVADDHVRLEVTLPWLLARIAQRFTGAIRKEGTLMLEKK